MNRAASLLLIVFIVSLGAEEREKSPVSVDAKEGKSVYAPLKPPIDFYEEVRIQELDQNATHPRLQQ